MVTLIDSILKGFTPEVKLWQVCYSKSGSFERVNRAFELTGHTSGILR